MGTLGITIHAGEGRGAQAIENIRASVLQVWVTNPNPNLNPKLINHNPNLNPNPNHKPNLNPNPNPNPNSYMPPVSGMVWPRASPRS